MKRAEGLMSSFVKRIHFVGIGGIGMSGIAEVLLNLGYTVSGSDAKRTEITERLAKAGARVRLGHKASNIGRAQVLVYSSAIDPKNPELLEARRRGLSIVGRAMMLAELARLKKTITVAGSHGKTTTTSMVAMALRAAGADPTMIIGGQLKNIGSNARIGLGDYLVAEADESDGSFVHLTPLIAVVTNIDDDHLDHYGRMERLESAFLRHLEKLPFYGAAVLCAEDPRLMRVALKLQRPVVTYGFGKADWQARAVSLAATGSSFDVCHRGRRVAKAKLRVAGRHNVLNALGAIAAGAHLGFDIKRLLSGLAAFKGVGRRLEKLGEASGVLFLDDYGHHPTEVAATLAAVKDLHCAQSKAHPKGRRLLVVFQPHRFTRTKLLASKFGPAFKKADRVFVMEVYAAGEKAIKGVSRGLILKALSKARVAGAPFDRPVDVVRELRPGDVVLTLGAGDVWKSGEDLRRRLQSGTLASV